MARSPRRTGPSKLENIGGSRVPLIHWFRRFLFGKECGRDDLSYHRMEQRLINQAYEKLITGIPPSKLKLTP